MAFRPADLSVAGGGSAADTPSMAFRPADLSAADDDVESETAAIAVTGGTGSSCVRRFHSAKPDLRFLLSLVARKPFPLSAGPLASLHAPCFARVVDPCLPEERGRPLDADRGGLNDGLMGEALGAVNVSVVGLLASGLAAPQAGFFAAGGGAVTPACVCIVEYIFSTAAFPDPFGTSLSTKVLLFSGVIFNR